MLGVRALPSRTNRWSDFCAIPNWDDPTPTRPTNPLSVRAHSAHPGCNGPGEGGWSDTELIRATQRTMIFSTILNVFWIYCTIDYWSVNWREIDHFYLKRSEHQNGHWTDQ